MVTVKEFLSHVSEKPWSSIKESDYSLEQWHSACLIHQHTGTTPGSKDECKLPVKTPDGVLNRNGVHAAAAALSGARSSLQASTEQKGEAARKLAAMYTKLDEEPPESIIKMKHSYLDEAFNADVMDIKEFLEHHGVKGMKWGVRKGGSVRVGSHPTTKSGHPVHEDFIKARLNNAKGAAALSTPDLKAVNERRQAEQKFAQLNPTAVQRGHNKVKAVLAVAGTAAAFYKAYHSPAGQAAIKSAKKFSTRMFTDPKEAARLERIAGHAKAAAFV